MIKMMLTKMDITQHPHSLTKILRCVSVYSIQVQRQKIFSFTIKRPSFSPISHIFLNDSLVSKIFLIIHTHSDKMSSRMGPLKMTSFYHISHSLRVKINWGSDWYATIYRRKKQTKTTGDESKLCFPC